MSKRNRRQFLEDSMVAAAATIAATSGANVFAEEEKQSTSPNEKLGVAVVGVRGRGGSHIGAFAGRKDTEVLYIVDADRDVGNRRAKEVGKRQGGRVPEFVEDMRAAFDDKRVDIVSIATPNHWHALAAIWAIQAGKDVYVEKPVSHNVSEGRRIVEAARKYKKICQTGTQCRSNPGMIKIMDYVQSGKLGDVKVGRGLCYKRRKSIGAAGKYDPPSSVNYGMWLGPAPKVQLSRRQFHYDWHWQTAYGNGDLGNQGIHQMDLARWGLGVNTLSNNVVSYGGRLGYKDAGNVANTQVVVHDYGAKTLVFEVRGLETPSYKGSKIGVIFEGTEGFAVVASYNGGTVFDPDGKKVTSFNGGADHFANFLKAVRSRKASDLNADIEEGHLSSALCHMGNISYELGEQVAVQDALSKLGEINSHDDAKDTLRRTLVHLEKNGVAPTTNVSVGPVLKFDPKKEVFIGNEAANVKLSRDYRKPFVVPSAAEV